MKRMFDIVAKNARPRDTRPLPHLRSVPAVSAVTTPAGFCLGQADVRADDRGVGADDVGR
jgi:hypothetical protein